MSTNTTYYNLIKPGSADFVDVNQLDSNFDTLDSQLHTLSNNYQSNSSALNILNPLGAAWTSFAGNCSWSLGSSASFFNNINNHLVFWRYKGQLGTVGPSGGLTVSLPVSLSAGIGSFYAFAACAYDSSANLYYPIHGIQISATTVGFRDGTGNTINPTTPFTWANGDQFWVSGVYEVI